MKRLSILLVTMDLTLTLGGGFSAHAAAQDTPPSPWFPKGAEWYYGLFGQDELYGATGCIHMTVTTDTLFAGRLCKQLKLEACDGKYETLYEYVYPCGDSLFYYNYAAQDFFLLLNMSAKKGDTIWVHDSSFVPNPGFDPYRLLSVYDEFKFMAYRIVAVDTVMMQGEARKRQRIDPIIIRLNDKEWSGWERSGWEFPSNDPYKIYHMVIEGIGSIGAFWGEPTPRHMEWGGWKLRCFFAEGKTYMTDGKCDNLAAEPLVDNPAASWRLSPQPTSDKVRAVCEATEAGRRCGHWRLCDRTGKTLQAGRFVDGAFELSLAGCANGLYLVEIVSGDGTACRLKCVKTE